MTLHPQAVAVLAAQAGAPVVTDPGFGPEGVAAMRAGDREAAALEDREPVDLVEDVDADGVPCRLFVSAGAERAVVLLHGGGFVFGDLDTHDAQSRRVANRTGSAVLAVDYRRPPEHRFPAAPDDVDTALRWLVGHAPSRGLDPRRVVALGDSAGGNLALVAALRNPGVLAACVLVYPFTDARTSVPSYAATDGNLTRAEAQWYWAQYARDTADLDDPDLSPYAAASFAGLPPTLVQVAEHDVLADEDVELARRMQADGVSVELTTYDGMIHGFWRHPAEFDAAEVALEEIRGFLSRHV
jgi:acetyl esterase